jgi:hypothetical protein
MRNGKFTVKKLVQEDKILVEDLIITPLASSITELGTTVAVGVGKTNWLPKLTLRTASADFLDYPRTIRIRNRSVSNKGPGTVIVAGYNSMGEYVHELISVPKTTASTIESSWPYIHLDSIKWNNKKGTGYSAAASVSGTVSVGITSRFGLKKPLAAVSDILSITYTFTSSTGVSSTKAVPSYASASLISTDYNTIQLKGRSPAGSTVIIRYLTKWQK